MRLLYALLPLLLLLASSAAPAYVYIPPSLGQLCKEASHIAVLRVEHVDAENKALVFTRVRHLKGEFPTERLVQKFGKNYVDPHGELNPVAEAVVGQEAVVFERGGFGVLLVGRAWYQMYRDEKTPDKDWMPYMAGSDFWYAYWGDAAGLIPAVKDVLAGKEVVIECLVDRSRDHNGRPKTAKVHASLNRLGFDPRRDRAD